MSDYPTTAADDSLPLFAKTPDAGGDVEHSGESASPADGFSATNPIARASDPETSRLAASQLGDNRAVQRLAMLQAFRTMTARGKDLSANEAATLAVEVCGGQVEHVRKRYIDLVYEELIETCSARHCLITGKKVTTYKAVQ